MIDRSLLLDDALSRALPLYRAVRDRLAGLDEAGLNALRPLAYEAAADLSLIVRLSDGVAATSVPLRAGLQAVAESLILLSATVDVSVVGRLPMVDEGRLETLLASSPRLCALLREGDDEARRLVADTLGGVGRAE